MVWICSSLQCWARLHVEVLENSKKALLVRRCKKIGNGIASLEEYENWKKASMVWRCKKIVNWSKHIGNMQNVLYIFRKFQITLKIGFGTSGLRATLFPQKYEVKIPLMNFATLFTEPWLFPAVISITKSPRFLFLSCENVFFKVNCFPVVFLMTEAEWRFHILLFLI